MHLLPLSLAINPDAWNPDGSAAGGQAPIHDFRASCRFCGLPAAGWQEAVCLPCDAGGHPAGTVVAACPLCHLVHNVNRPGIGREAMLIWLPEMSQAALIAIVRGIHLVLYAHREPAPMTRGRPRDDTEQLRSAWTLYEALRDRGAVALARLRTTAPGDLAAALSQLSPPARARQAALLWGVRLLPLGRLYQADKDIYPQMLDCWTTAAAEPPSDCAEVA